MGLGTLVFDFSAMGNLMKGMGQTAKGFGSFFNPSNWKN
tara:strand:- start:311 stop:427 length:117 start_codon:yes stop_codon:yes gene_type:complete